MEYGETVEQAAKRELHEECGLRVQLDSLVGVYSDPKRQPNKHVIAICYSGHVTGQKLKTDSLEGVNHFFPVDRIPKRLAFDHHKMIKDYLNFRM